jgi:hypothetical protein
LKQYNIKILLLSRGRSDKATTPALLPDWVEIPVPESEKLLYQQNFPNPILVTPDNIKGIGNLRNWVLDNFAENTIIMIDDDIKYMYCNTALKARQVTDPNEVVQILINDAVMANDLGVHIFGFAQTDIRKYSGCEPFSFNGWVGCCIGVIGRKFRFREDYFKVDIDYCLKCLLVDRIIFIDNRYYFLQNRDNNKGGNATFRTQELFEKSIKSLFDKWQGCLVKKENKSQVSIKITTTRRQRL